MNSKRKILLSADVEPTKKTRHREWANSLTLEDQLSLHQEVEQEVMGIPPLLRADFKGGDRQIPSIFEARFSILIAYKILLETTWEWVLLNWQATEFAFYLWLAVGCLRGIESPEAIVVLPSHWMSLVILRHFLLVLFTTPDRAGCPHDIMSLSRDPSPARPLYSKPFHGRRGGSQGGPTLCFFHALRAFLMCRTMLAADDLRACAAWKGCGRMRPILPNEEILVGLFGENERERPPPGGGHRPRGGR